MSVLNPLRLPVLCFFALLIVLTSAMGNQSDNIVKEWKIGASTYQAMPEKGARLMSWTLNFGNDNLREVIHWPKDADLSHPEKVRGGNPILFPFVARTFSGTKENFWDSPSGDVLPMPRHGFARQGKFIISDFHDFGFSATLEPTAEDQKCYPFTYEFTVKYVFSELFFTVEFLLENKDSQPIPWCAGHHFYFSVPWHKGLTLEDYRALIPAKKAFKHGSDGKLIPIKDVAMDGGNLSDDNIIDLIHCKLLSNKVSFGPKGGEEDVSIIIGDDPRPTPWTAVTTWCADKTSGHYCVEPWMGPPNAPSHKKGLHWVNPGETDSFKVKVSIME